MKLSYLTILALLILPPSYAVEKANKNRLDEVALKGAQVMPFDLDRTTHIFSKVPKGGIQQVIVKNSKDYDQIKLIREHLSQVSNEFQQGNFSNPAKIHGAAMPGLEALRKAIPNLIKIRYKKIPKGAEIIYSTNSPALITAIHQWFDAQLSDHSRHAISGHSMHKMHNKKN